MLQVKLFERFLVTRSRRSTNVNGVVPMRSRRNAGLQLDCTLSTFRGVFPALIF
jgi:hypothetical protein